jgi:hypothetical protein
MAHEGVPLIVIQRQLGHSNLGITSQGRDGAVSALPPVRLPAPPSEPDVASSPASGSPQDARWPIVTLRC